MSDSKRLMMRVMPNLAEQASFGSDQQNRYKQNKTVTLSRRCAYANNITDEKYFKLDSEKGQSSRPKKGRTAALASLKEYLFTRDPREFKNLGYLTDLHSQSKMANNVKDESCPSKVTYQSKIKNDKYLLRSTSNHKLDRSNSNVARNLFGGIGTDNKLNQRTDSIEQMALDQSQLQPSSLKLIKCIGLCLSMRSHILSLWEFMDKDASKLEQLLLEIFDDNIIDKSQRLLLRQILSGDQTDIIAQWPGSSLEPVVLLRLMNINHGCQRVFIDSLK